VIATAHKETINQAVGNLQRRRNEVLAIRGLEVSKPVEQVKLPDYVSYNCSRALSAAFKDGHSLLVQERWRSVAYIQELEDDTQ